MRKPSISQLVYKTLYPHRTNDDPTSFASYIGRNIVPELRIEVFNFYGNFDEIEAKYPGLDYSHPPHRLRLGRFPNHRKLFRVFDELGLTKSEIYWLCSWEGTKLARDRFEKDQGVKVHDTTGSEIIVAPPPQGQRVIVHNWSEKPSKATQKSSVQQDRRVHFAAPPKSPESVSVRDEDEAMSSESEGSEEAPVEEETYQPRPSESYGYMLNQQLMAANAARVQGHANIPLDAAYEQWLKDEVERNALQGAISTARTRSSATHQPQPSSSHGNNHTLPWNAAGSMSLRLDDADLPEDIRMQMNLLRRAERRAQRMRAHGSSQWLGSHGLSLPTNAHSLAPLNLPAVSNNMPSASASLQAPISDWQLQQDILRRQAAAARYQQAHRDWETRRQSLRQFEARRPEQQAGDNNAGSASANRSLS